MARKKSAAKARAHLETVTIPVSSLVVDGRRNSRQLGGSRALLDRATAPRTEMSLDELEDSIRSEGLLQPPGVSKHAKGYRLEYGYRRVTACLRIDPQMPITCVVIETDAIGLAVANIAENVHRRQIREFELALAVKRIIDENPLVSVESIAKRLALRPRLVRELALVCKRAAPELWLVFPRFGGRPGTGMQWKQIVPLMEYEHDEQVAMWRQQLKTERTNRARGQGSGRRIDGGADSVAKRLKELRAMPSTPYREGLIAGIRFSIGRCSFYDALHDDPATSGQQLTADQQRAASV